MPLLSRRRFMWHLLFLSAPSLWSGDSGPRAGVVAVDVSKYHGKQTEKEPPAIGSAPVLTTEANADFWRTSIFQIGSSALAGLAVIKGIEHGHERRNRSGEKLVMLTLLGVAVLAGYVLKSLLHKPLNWLSTPLLVPNMELSRCPQLQVKLHELMVLYPKAASFPAVLALLLGPGIVAARFWWVATLKRNKKHGWRSYIAYQWVRFCGGVTLTALLQVTDVVSDFSVFIVFANRRLWFFSTLSGVGMLVYPLTTWWRARHLELVDEPACRRWLIWPLLYILEIPLLAGILTTWRTGQKTIGLYFDKLEALTLESLVQLMLQTYVVQIDPAISDSVTTKLSICLSTLNAANLLALDLDLFGESQGLEIKDHVRIDGEDAEDFHVSMERWKASHGKVDSKTEYSVKDGSGTEYPLTFITHAKLYGKNDWLPITTVVRKPSLLLKIFCFLFRLAEILHAALTLTYFLAILRRTAGLHDLHKSGNVWAVAVLATVDCAILAAILHHTEGCSRWHRAPYFLLASPPRSISAYRRIQPFYHLFRLAQALTLLGVAVHCAGQEVIVAHLCSQPAMSFLLAASTVLYVLFLPLKLLHDCSPEPSEQQQSQDYIALNTAEPQDMSLNARMDKRMAALRATVRADDVALLEELQPLSGVMLARVAEYGFQQRSKRVLAWLARNFPEHLQDKTVLGFGQADMSPEDLRLMLPVIAQMKLKRVDLYGNPLGPSGVHILASVLVDERHEELQWLNLNATGMRSEGVRSLVPALARLQKLECLWMWGNDLGVEGVMELVPVIPKMSALKTLHLESNSIHENSDVQAAVHQALPSDACEVFFDQDPVLQFD